MRIWAVRFYAVSRPHGQKDILGPSCEPEDKDIRRQIDLQVGQGFFVYLFSCTFQSKLLKSL